MPNNFLKYFEKFGNVFLEFSVRCQVLICNSGGVLSVGYHGSLHLFSPRRYL